MPLIQTMINALPLGPEVNLPGHLGERGITVRAPPPRVPLVVLYHLDANRGDATIIIGSTRCVFVDCSFEWVSTRMLAIAHDLDGGGPQDVLISHFDKDHFYGINVVVGEAPAPLRIVTPAHPHQLDESTHLNSCRHRPRNAVSINDDLLGRLQLLADRNGVGSSRRCLDGTCTRPKANTAPTLMSAQEVRLIALGGGVTMRAVYNAAPQNLAGLRDNNDSSIAWVLTAAGVNYYTAGDLEHGEGAVAPEGDQRFHIVKCGHHGSRSATSTDFLTKAKPILAVLQGCASDYGHPMPEVLTRLQASGARAIATGLYRAFDEQIPLPTVCGDQRDIAGDLAVVIWSDGVFSAHWNSADGLRHTAWTVGGGAFDLGPGELAAAACLRLAHNTPHTKDFNADLVLAKRQHAYVAEAPKERKRQREGVREEREAKRTDCDLCLKEDRERPNRPSHRCEGCKIAICAEHAEEKEGEMLCSDCAQY